MRSNHDAWTQFFDVGKDILSAEADSQTGGIIGQLGNATDSTADSDRFEMWGPPGYYAVPAPPTAGQPSTQAFAIRASDHDLVIAVRDSRGAKVVGNLKPGDRCIASELGSARALVRADGSVTLSTKDDNATGNDVYARVAPDGFLFWGPLGSFRSDTTGFHARTWHGAKLDMGGAGIPSPLAVYSSFVSVTANIIRLKGTLTQIGQDNGNSQALAQVTTLSAQLALLTTAVQSLASAVAAFTGSGTFPGLPAAQTQISTATTAIAALPVSCGTKSMTAA